MKSRRLLSIFGLLALAGLLAPPAFVAWVSFSPDSFLTPPVEAWSFRWYTAFAADRRWLLALVRGLVVAVGAAGVAVAAGAPVAYAIARFCFRGRTLLAAAALAPACIPPAILGTGLLPLFLAAGLWGNPIGLMLAHGLLGVPVVTLIVAARLRQLPTDLEAAARGLGATPWQVACRVTLPLVRPALLAGGVASFALSLNEAMLTTFLATPTSETLPVVAFAELRHAASPMVAVASVVGMTAGLIAVGVVLRPRFGIASPNVPRSPVGRSQTDLPRFGIAR